MIFLAFNTSLNFTGATDNIESSILRLYADVEASTEDWDAVDPVFFNLEKRYIGLAPETLLDGQFINESVKLTSNGPMIINNLADVPTQMSFRYGLTMFFQTRIMGCKLVLLLRAKYLYLFLRDDQGQLS